MNTVLTSFTLLIPRPPSSLGQHTSSQAIFALEVMFGEPLHKKAEHMLSISSIHACGKQKAAHQKLVMLAMTDLMSTRRPAYERALLVHESRQFFIFVVSGSLSFLVMIFVVRGRLRYLIGSYEIESPELAAASSRARLPRPAANTVDFATLIRSPDIVANSSNT